MSSINDYIRPTDYGYVRKDINKILALIHDITAQEPEDEGLQERICISSNVKRRTSTGTTGSTSRTNTDVKAVEIAMFRKRIPPVVSSYSLIHTTTGTLTFVANNHKLGGGGTFDGSSYITIDNHAKLNVTTISFGGWFYLPATDSGDTDSQVLIDKGAYSLTIDPHATAANQLRATVEAFSAVTLETEIPANLQTEDSLDLEGDELGDVDITYAFNANAWNHIWVTIGEPNMKLYLNGSVVASTTALGTVQTNSNDLIIG